MAAEKWPNRLSAGKDGSKITTVVATPGQGPDRQQDIAYADTKVIGNGSFGVVYQARLVETNELVAIKRVLQDKRFKNRELQIMRRLDHYNIVKLKYYFYTSGEKVRGECSAAGTRPAASAAVCCPFMSRNDV